MAWTLFGSNEPSKPDLEAPSVRVVFQPLKGRASGVVVPYEEGMVTQSALDQSRAMKRFKRASMHVRRQVPGTQNVAKMKVDYDHRKKQVDPLFDYALYPGDTIEVVEEKHSPMADFVMTALGPMGAMLEGDPQ